MLIEKLQDIYTKMRLWGENGVPRRSRSTFVAKVSQRSSKAWGLADLAGKWAANRSAHLYSLALLSGTRRSTYGTSCHGARSVCGPAKKLAGWSRVVDPGLG